MVVVNSNYQTEGPKEQLPRHRKRVLLQLIKKKGDYYETIVDKAQHHGRSEHLHLRAQKKRATLKLRSTSKKISCPYFRKRKTASIRVLHHRTQVAPTRSRNSKYDVFQISTIIL